jgi:chitinase
LPVSAGYLSNVEIQDIIAGAGVDESDGFDDGIFGGAGTVTTYNVSQYQDEGDVLVYNGTWVSWLSPGSYTARQSWLDGLHMGGSVDWAVDLNATYLNKGTGAKDIADAEGDYTPCDDKTFSTLEDLQAAQGLDADCVPLYTLQTLITMLDTTYANYTDVNNGYDDVFGYYVTYMKKLVPLILENDFMWNMTTTNSHLYNVVVPDAGFGLLRELFS